MATHSRSTPLLLLLLILLSSPMVSTWLDPFFPMADPSPGVVVSRLTLFTLAQKNTFSLFSRSKPEVKLDDQESIKREKEVLEALSGISSLKSFKEDNKSNKKAKVDNEVKKNEQQVKEVNSGGEKGGNKDKAENKSAKKLLPKRKGVDALLEAVAAESPPSQFPPPKSELDNKDNKDKNSDTATNTDNKIDNKIQQEKNDEMRSIKEPTKSTTKKKKKKTGHEDDIIHEHDHADNDAYDDIVWYDGPHSDDEDEHGDHHDDDHDDDDHDDEHDDDHHDGDHGEDEDEPPKSPEKQVLHLQQQPEVLSNLQKLSGTNSKSKSNTDSPGDERPSSEHIHDDAHDGSPGTFHHSGADAIQGSVSPTEFCLRLKHECESTCREFKAGVLHISTTCESGSVAELLFWGKCCQIGQERRANTLSFDLNGSKKSKKKAQGQSGQSKQQKQGQKVLQGQPQQEQKQGEKENDPSQQYLKRQQKRHEAKRAAEADLQKSAS